MAYQFSTGFDFYTTATQIWDSSQGVGTISSANARFTGTHSQGISLPQNAWLRKNLSASVVTTIMGFAIKTATLPSGTNMAFVSLEDSTSTQVSLGCTNAGVLQFFRGLPGSNVPIGSTGSTNFTAAVYHYLEVLVTISATVGVAQCWLDGIQIINSSGLNTKATGNTSVNQFRIGDVANNIGVIYDDLYCLDGTGGSLNARLGERRIITIMPSAPGSFSQFTPIGATPNWNCVKEIPPDDDTTYVADGVVNDRDSYDFETVSINGNPDFVVPWGRVRKDDAGSHTVELSVTNAGNDAFSSAIAVPASYAYINGGAFTTNPNGSVAWDQSGINSTEFGIKIIT